MFLDIEKSLEEVRPRFLGMSLNLQGSTKEFSYVEEMLKQERCQFEVSLFSRNERNYYTMSNILLISTSPFACYYTLILPTRITLWSQFLVNICSKFSLMRHNEHIIHLLFIYLGI